MTKPEKQPSIFDGKSILAQMIRIGCLWCPVTGSGKSLLETWFSVCLRCPAMWELYER